MCDLISNFACMLDVEQILNVPATWVMVAED